MNSAREVGNISLDNAFSRFEVLTAVLMIEVCGILNRVDWQIATDIAGAPVTSNCKVQQSEMEAAPPSDETAIKKIWKILSTNGTMDKMRKDLHEDPKFKEWQETFNKDLQRIIESDDTKSYEKIFTELGGLEMPNSTECSDKLEDLLKQVVDQKLCTLPEETKAEIFRKWDGIVKSHRYH